MQDCFWFIWYTYKVPSYLVPLPNQGQEAPLLLSHHLSSAQSMQIPISSGEVSGITENQVFKEVIVFVIFFKRSSDIKLRHKLIFADP